VVCALHSIADARCLENVLVDFFLAIADQGGVDHVIKLVESSNLDVAEAALLVVHRIMLVDLKIYHPRESIFRYFLKRGVTQALLRHLACDSSHRFQQAIHALGFFCFMMEPPLFASTVLHLIRILPSLENLAKIVVISALSFLIPEVDSTHLDPSIPRLLLQLARDATTSLELLTEIVILMNRLISNCGLWEGFRAAGMESFLADPAILALG
jgi:hypothetical protein